MSVGDGGGRMSGRRLQRERGERRSDARPECNAVRCIAVMCSDIHLQVSLHLVNWTMRMVDGWMGTHG